MTVNRFDSPVKDEYISLYVPIPFEQLYALGKAYNEDVDKAYSQLGDLIQKWSDFKSPSQVDTKRWYDLTMAPAKLLVDEISTNPDLMKSVEGRTKVLLFINSRPYLELSMLKQSKDQMLARLAAELKLSLAGKYNPLWHLFDYSSYDTLNPKNGIFLDINLTPYMSEVDLVKPYVDNLLDEFIPELSNSIYDYKGVTTKRTDDAVKQNWSAIYNTPEALMHLKALVKQGYTPEQALALFADRIYRAGREFARVNRDLNAGGRYLASHGSGLENPTNKPFLLTQGLQLEGLTSYMTGKENYLSTLPLYKTAMEMVNSGNPEYKEKGLKVINDLRNDKDITLNKMYNNVMDQVESYIAPISLTDNSQNDGQLLKDYNNAILSNFGFTINNSELNDHLLTTVKGVSNDKKETPFGKKRTISGGTDLVLTSKLILDVSNRNSNRKINSMNSMNAFQNALNSGKFENMILLGNGSVLPIPVSNGNSTISENYLTVNVSIPEKYILLAGLTEEDMKSIGATLSIPGEDKTKFSESNTESGKINSDGEKKPKKYSISNTKTTGTENRYWVVDLSSRLPKPGDKLSAEAIDRGWMLKSLSSTMADPQYTYIQQNAIQ